MMARSRSVKRGMWLGLSISGMYIQCEDQERNEACGWRWHWWESSSVIQCVSIQVQHTDA